MAQPAALPDNEARRLETLRDLAVLDTPPEERFDRICRLVTQHFQVPIALISLVDEDRQWFKSRCGMDAGETPRDIAFCPHAILQDGVFVVPDATLDPRFRHNPLVTGAPGIRFYAGSPLVAQDGSKIGTLCIIDHKPRAGLSSAEERCLEDFSAMAIETLERHAAEKKLHESREYLSAVLDNIADGVVACDADGSLSFFNDAARKIHGIARKDLPPNRWAEHYDLYGPDGETRLETGSIPLVRALRGEDVVDAETVIAPSGGSVRHVVSNGRAMHDASGRKIGAVVSMHDISEIKKAEEKFRDSEARLRQQKAELDLIFNNVPVRIWYKDDENRIIRLNQPAAESMGLTVDEAEGADTYDLFPEMAAKYHEDDLAAIEGGEPVLGIVEEYTPKDGTRGWVRTDKVPHVNPETGERFLFVAAIDITGMKLAEEKLQKNEARYRALYRHTPVMMHSIDNEGRLLHVSDHWLETLGYERDEVIGRKSTEFLTEDSRLHALEVVLPRFQREGRCTDIEYQFVRKDGGTVDVLLSAVAEYDEVSAKAYSLCVMIDVTEHRKVERQLMQAQKMEAVGQLTGGMAHDFNNLLAVVLGNLQLLERSVAGDEKAMRRAASAVEAAQRGTELTQRLLAFSRRQTLQAEVVDPNELITGMDDFLRRSIGESIELELAVAEDVWRTKVDPNQLETALLNLAVNARDAMCGGGHLTVETRTATLDEAYSESHTDVAPGDYVVIAVSDTGTGMPEAVRERVFEPFFSTKETGKGTGLGLSMVYGFAKQSGGHTEIYSEEGNGTTVRLYLPRDRSAAAPAPCRPGDQQVIPGGSETVLAAEDNPDVREVAVSLLEDLGYKVVEAENGHEALRVLGERDDIDLLFTDMVMPGGMNGAELAVAALARRPDLKILYTTGFAEASVLRRRELHAKAAILTKPYMQPELALAVREALDVERVPVRLREAS